MIRIVLAVCSLLLGVAAHAGDAPATLLISDVWMRASLGQVPTTTAYLKIENRGSADDKLLSVSTPVAAMAHLHQSAETNGVMTMAAVAALPIKPGQTVELAPGGLHIMVMNLKAPLKAGETVPLTLKFERAGEMTVQAEVRGLGKTP
jgi:periplasmic copper chaperone A